MRHHSWKQSHGMVLPLTFVLLVALSIAAISITQHFCNTNKMEGYHVVMKNKLMGGAMTGINYAMSDVKNSSNDALSHVWQSGYVNTYTLQVGDQSVTVTEEDVQIAL